MAIAGLLRLLGGFPLLALATGQAALAQSGGELLAPPMAQQVAQQRMAGQCPLIVPASQQAIQPMRLDPALVAAKNRMGCLSPDDAIYGADGCPLRRCGEAAGVFQLPAP